MIQDFIDGKFAYLTWTLQLKYYLSTNSRGNTKDCSILEVPEQVSLSSLANCV